MGGKTIKTLLFLHGWGCDKNVWHAQAEHFSAKYDVVALNLAGFGGEPLEKPVMTVFDYAASVARVINEMGLKNVTVVGHSFGGRIAVVLDAFYPSLVEKIVLVSSAGVRRFSLKRTLKTYIYKSKKLLVKCGLLPAYALLSSGSADYLSLDPKMKPTFLNAVNTDLRRYARLVRRPVLLVWGDADRETPLSDGKLLARLTGGGLAVMEGCGHYCFLQNGALFNRILEAFLQD